MHPFRKKITIIFLSLFFLSFFFFACTRQKLQTSKLALSQKNKMSFVTGGPYAFEKIKNFVLPLNPYESVESDLYLCKSCKEASLVILLHGNLFSRQAHSYQAEKLASWGINTLLLDLPNSKQWTSNAKRVQNIVQLISAFPKVINSQLNPKKIILAGHSFGGYSVTLAASRLKDKIAGLILLDPAVFNAKKLKHAMKKIKVPSIILAADPLRYKAKKGHYFFDFATFDTLHMSIAGTDHLHAQWPSIHKVQWGFDFRDSSYHKRYLEAFLLSALSFSKFKGISESWSSFSDLLKQGLIKDSQMKFVSEK